MKTIRIVKLEPAEEITIRSKSGDELWIQLILNEEDQPIMMVRDRNHKKPARRVY